MSMLVMAPIVVLFILLRGTIVWILYAPSFEVIYSLISWGMIGIVWRTLSWCMAFVILAKGDGKMFLITEAVSDVIGFGLNVWFYQLWGLTGLGISFMVWYIIYTAMIYVVYRWHYGLQLTPSSLLTTIFALCGASAVMMAMQYNLTAVAVAVTVVVTLVSAVLIKRQWTR